MLRRSSPMKLSVVSTSPMPIVALRPSPKNTSALPGRSGWPGLARSSIFAVRTSSAVLPCGSVLASGSIFPCGPVLSVGQPDLARVTSNFDFNEERTHRFLPPHPFCNERVSARLARLSGPPCSPICARRTVLPARQYVKNSHCIPRALDKPCCSILSWRPAV